MKRLLLLLRLRARLSLPTTLSKPRGEVRSSSSSNERAVEDGEDGGLCRALLYKLFTHSSKVVVVVVVVVWHGYTHLSLW